MSGNQLPTSGVNATAATNPSTHAIRATSSRINPRKKANKVDNPITATTIQSNEVIASRPFRTVFKL